MNRHEVCQPGVGDEERMQKTELIKDAIRPAAENAIEKIEETIFEYERRSDAEQGIRGIADILQEMKCSAQSGFAGRFTYDYHERAFYHQRFLKTIESLLPESEENVPSPVPAKETLLRMKHALWEATKVDLSAVKDGEAFYYRGIRFLRLGREQGGVLCIAHRDSLYGLYDFRRVSFNMDDGYYAGNNWRESSVRRMLREEFLPLLDEKDLLPLRMDLTAADGDAAYGVCEDKVGILPMSLYKKYEDTADEAYALCWTCTPGQCRTLGGVLIADCTTDEQLSLNPNDTCGVSPACVFRMEEKLEEMQDAYFEAKKKAE